MNSTLPPGLVDQNIEFFTHDGILKAVCNGRVCGFYEVPNAAKKALMDEMLERPDIMQAFDAAGVQRLDDQLYVYAKCLYGGFNNVPDMTEFGITAPDNHTCECNGNCVLKPIVKHILPVAFGYLTPREIDIVRLLTQNLMGKQIAAKLRICENTVNKHKQNIFSKTGLTSNVEIAVWATNNNVL